MMLRRQFLAGAAAASALPLGLSRPSVAQGAGARVLRFVPQADVTVLDPVMTTAYVTRNHALMIYDTLYGTDSQLRPKPQMVEGHTLENDGLLWTFRLRDGLKFHDGEPVRGRDCIASIRRWSARDAFGQALMARVAEMTAPDDRTFRIRLNKPFGPMLDTLSKVGPPALCIMPERLAATDPFTPVKEHIGSGPFRFKEDERIVGARAVYEKFAGYAPRADGETDWTAGPKIVHFDRVEWQVMPDAGTKAAALANGEVDWWENPPNDLLPLLQGNRDITIDLVNTLGGLGTGIFNHLHPPFNNVAIRRAVLSAMSQDDFMIAAAGTDPKAIRTGIGIFTPDTPLANDAGLELITSPRNLEAAKKAVADAGYKGERVVLMSASDNPLLSALGDVGHDLLTKLGFNVDYMVTDWGTVVQRRASREKPENGGWSMFHTTWNGVDTLNPAVNQTLRSSGDKAWFGWPDVPKLEEARLAWLDASTLEEQQRLARDIQALALQEAVYLPTGQYFQPSAYRRNLTGVLKGQFVFWNVQRG